MRDCARRSRSALRPRELEAAASAAYAAIAALRERVVAAPATGLSERATFVLATGELGASLRRATGLCGWTPKLPYPARFPVRGNTADEPVSAFTLPAPRLPAPSDARPYDDPRFVALGERLFQDKALSEARDRACTTCHEPAKGFADGRARPASLTPEEAPLRHAPTLLYTSLHAAQMWDGRTLTAEDQAIGVIHARAEMGLAEGELLARLGAEPSYSAAFAALPGGLVAANVGRALAAFESTRLAPGTSPLDAFARGEANALDADARRGFDVLAGKGRCTRCHVPPSFAGSRPRDFAVPIFAALGVPTDPSGKTLDPDPWAGQDHGPRAGRRRLQDAHAARHRVHRAVLSQRGLRHAGVGRGLLRPRGRQGPRPGRAEPGSGRDSAEAIGRRTPRFVALFATYAHGAGAAEAALSAGASAARGTYVPASQRVKSSSARALSAA
jgi:cytochrome c peroxidase